MPYDEVSNWPVRIDSFPTLVDNTSPVVDDSEVLWAQHYNKLRAAIYNLQKYWTGVNVASGDGSFNTISQGMTISVPVSVVSQIVARGAYETFNGENNLNTQNIPGNTLPFEFVFTTSTDDYRTWVGGEEDDWGLKMFIQEDTSYFSKFLGAALEGAYPLVTCTVQDLHSSDRVIPPLMAQAWAMVGSDTLVVRGFLQDLNSAPTGRFERWDQYQMFHLHCTILMCSTNR